MTLTDLPPQLRDLTVPADGPTLLPLNAGEQYRFSFAMDACIGCHSCEVACAEQNGNPIDVHWRRVGELEGGSFPSTRRFNLSMACNHCLEPACLTGCPTNAYIKLDNGVVKHNADDCVGCQYCIWNCPYEVPVFNPQRRIVTKCDMCLPRLEVGELPACVLACPTQAITVEKVDVAAWRHDHLEADAPGLPSAAITLSTTRVRLPSDVPVDTLAVHEHRVAPADPHWPLIALTLLSQLAIGTVAVGVLFRLAAVAIVGFGVGTVALASSLLHLGRPAHAWKAMRNLRRSWLSREVALFGAFTASSMAYAASHAVHRPLALAGALAVVCGAAGLYASGRLYLLPARPVWNSRRTIVSFFATALATGPALALLVAGTAGLSASAVRLLLAAAAAGTVLQLSLYHHLAMTVTGRHEREYRGSAQLLFGHFRPLLTARVGLALAAVALLLLAATQSGSPLGLVLLLVPALALTAASELIGRYLFYVTVVPMTAAGSFFPAQP